MLDFPEKWSGKAEQSRPGFSKNQSKPLSGCEDSTSMVTDRPIYLFTAGQIRRSTHTLSSITTIGEANCLTWISPGGCSVKISPPKACWKKSLTSATSFKLDRRY